MVIFSKSLVVMHTNQIHSETACDTYYNGKHKTDETEAISFFGSAGCRCCFEKQSGVA